MTMPSRHSLRAELQDVFDKRAEQIDAARTETPFERRIRLGEVFADALRSQFDRLDQPQQPDQPDDSTAFAAEFQQFINDQEK